MRIVVCAGISGALTMVPDHAWLPVNDLTGSPCAFAIACGVAVAQSFCAHTALAALIPTPLPAPTPTALSASPAPPAAAPWCAVHTAMGRDTDKLRTAMAASTDPLRARLDKKRKAGWRSTKGFVSNFGASFRSRP